MYYLLGVVLVYPHFFYNRAIRFFVWRFKRNSYLKNVKTGNLKTFAPMVSAYLQPEIENLKHRVKTKHKHVRL